MNARAPALFRSPLLAAAALLFAIIGVLLALPDPTARPLFGPEGWQANGGFVEFSPPTKELRTGTATDPGTHYWRSWSPERGAQPGTLQSQPFDPGGNIGIPYNGFAGDPGLRVFIECVGTGTRHYLASSRTNTQWAEVLLDPTTWCKGNVRLIAESTSTQGYLSLGTPYRLGWLSVFKHSTFASIWFLLVAWASIAGVLVAGDHLARRMAGRVEPLAAGLICVGLAGYGFFYLFWFLPGIARWLGAMLVVASASLAIAGLLRTTPGDADAARLRWALLAWLGIALAYLALGLMGDNGAGPWAMNGRFTPARWSTDNQLPGFVARMLVSGEHGDLSDFGPWKVSDRPPLAYGWHALLHDVFQLMLGRSSSRPLFAEYQLAIGLALNSIWVMPIAMFLPGMGLTRRQVSVVIVILACCGFFVFNDLFVWPKLLSGTLTLVSAWLLLGLKPDAPPLREANTDLVCAAILAALGLMTHGGSVFGIAVAVAMAPVFRGMPSFKGALLAAASALAILLPWSAWQALVQPPGNALVKFAFAGTFGFGEEHMGVADTILRSYRDLDMSGWLARKGDGITTLLAGARNTCGIGEAGVTYSMIDGWRAHDFLYLFPSLNALLAGFIALARTPSQGGSKRVAMRLVAYALATILATWLLSWDCYLNHHQSYQALIALHLGLVLALLGAGTWGRIALGLNLAYGVLVWILEPLNHLPRFDPVAIALFVLLLAAAWRYWRHATAPASPSA